MPLHEEEFDIDADLVKSLLADQMPHWADLSLEELDTSGTVNVMFRLGDDRVVRLPRTAGLAAGPQRESACLRRFTESLPLRIPRHLALGEPTAAYPSHWSVLDWIEGATANKSTLADLHQAGEVLAGFITALRGMSTEWAPPGGSYRAFDLATVDHDLRRWTTQLPCDFDPGEVLGIWDMCLNAPEWKGTPTWLHSDLRGDNLLVHEGVLSAVIDWEDCAVGDPAADYLAAWWLFDADSRDAFRSATKASTPEWTRAKGWALHMAVAAIPYYIDSHPPFAAQARTALAEILADER